MLMFDFPEQVRCGRSLETTNALLRPLPEMKTVLHDKHVMSVSGERLLNVPVSPVDR